MFFRLISAKERVISSVIESPSNQIFNNNPLSVIKLYNNNNNNKKQENIRRRE